MKTYRYIGGPAMNGFTSRSGLHVTLHQGREYELDEENEFVQTLLGKRNGNGMPAPWLVEVESTQTNENEAAILEPEREPEPAPELVETAVEDADEKTLLENFDTDTEITEPKPKRKR
jgi:hypothetical protein